MHARACVAIVFFLGTIAGSSDLARSEVARPLGPAAFDRDEMRAIAPLRAAVRAAPEDLRAALVLARAHLRLAHRLGGERHLGYALATVGPWLRTASPEPEALVVRARVQQARHAFGAAEADLDTALALRPKLAEALLTRAFVRMTRGGLEAAAADCTALGQSRQLVAGALCSARLQSLTGSAERARDVLARLPIENPELRAWVLTLEADIALRLGDTAAALAATEAALALTPDDAHAMVARLDALLAADEPAAVLELIGHLDEAARTDAVRLRRGLARRELDAAAETDRFLAGEADHRHLREEAWAALDLADDPVLAVDLALANWQEQREPDDALVLLRAGLAAGHEGAITEARRWYAATGLEDVRAEGRR